MSQENSHENSWNQGKRDAETGNTPGGQKPGESWIGYQTRLTSFDSEKASQKDSSTKKP